MKTWFVKSLERRHLARDDELHVIDVGKVAYLAVGGLTKVGFGGGSMLLVISHQGRPRRQLRHQTAPKASSYQA